MLNVYKSKNNNNIKGFKEYTIFEKLWEDKIQLIRAEVDAGKKQEYKSNIVDRGQVQIALRDNSYMVNLEEVYNGCNK